MNPMKAHDRMANDIYLLHPVMANIHDYLLEWLIEKVLSQVLTEQNS